MDSDSIKHIDLISYLRGKKERIIRFFKIEALRLSKDLPNDLIDMELIMISKDDWQIEK